MAEEFKRAIPLPLKDGDSCAGCPFREDARDHPAATVWRAAPGGWENGKVEVEVPAHHVPEHCRNFSPGRFEYTGRRHAACPPFADEATERALRAVDAGAPFTSHYERGKDPWHADAFAPEHKFAAPNTGEREGGWYPTDWCGNFIGWIPDSALAAEVRRGFQQIMIFAEKA